MLDSRKTNPTCEFSNEIAAYLYKEMGSNERNEFENHLNECSTCPDELGAFSAVSSSIQNWRDSKFANLETPKIDIPYETVPESEYVGGLLGSVRALFRSSPVFLKTTGAFASLLLIAVLGWVLMNSLAGSNDRADSNDQTAEPTKKNNNVVAPDKPEVAVQSKPDSNTTVPEKSPEIAKDTGALKDKVPVKVTYKNRTKTGGTTNRKRTTRNRPPKSKKNNKGSNRRNPTPKVVEQPIDRLTEEFAIDESKAEELTLSDLLDELGSDD